MDFQAICRELGSRCEITGYNNIVPGASAGVHGKVVGWAREAWVSIQQEHEWSFLRKAMSFVTEANKADYTATIVQAQGAPVRRYDTETVRLYKESIGKPDEQYLTEWGWEHWYDVFGYGQQVSGRPSVFAVRPEDNAIVLGQVPDGIYRVVGYYWRQAQRLESPGDVPIIDEELHMAIVFKAMLTYANTEAAAEAKIEASERLDEVMSLMRRRYLHAGDSRGPMA